MAFFICCIALAFLTTGIIYFAAKTVGYSHVKHTISELGETGSRFEKQVSLGLFLPTGILLGVIGLLTKDNGNTAGLSLALAAGYIVAAFFPCDAGSPSYGSWKQQLHNAGGFIEYAGGIYFIMKAAETGIQIWGIPFKTIGFLIIVCTIIISLPNNRIRGLAQRIAELFLFGCLLWLLI